MDRYLRRYVNWALFSIHNFLICNYVRLKPNSLHSDVVRLVRCVLLVLKQVWWEEVSIVWLR